MTNEELANKIQEATMFWGTKWPTMCMEEGAEFIQAVARMDRATTTLKGSIDEWCTSYEKLTGEMANLLICIVGLSNYYDIDPLEIRFIMEEKVKKIYE